ncbi:MAG TPA: hypothetical protein DEB38_00580 [Acidimicrobiaceae bacterium]|nr:hypothetical protein [Acidimicrobiaceae bacterium]
MKNRIGKGVKVVRRAAAAGLTLFFLLPLGVVLATQRASVDGGRIDGYSLRAAANVEEHSELWYMKLVSIENTLNIDQNPYAYELVASEVDDDDNTPSGTSNVSGGSREVETGLDAPEEVAVEEPATEEVSEAPSGEKVSSAVAFPWTMSANAIGLNQIVDRGDDSNEVVDTGAIWHWTGSGMPDEYAHIVTFAHRTSKGGTFRDIHLLDVGDIITIEGPTGQSWSYSVAGSEVVDPGSADIYAEARSHGGPSISLVACSRADGTPTSLSYRLVVTAVRS